MRTACVSVYVYDALEFVKVEERQIIKSTEQILLACSFIFPSGNYIYIYTLYVLHDFFLSLHHSLYLCLSPALPLSVSLRFIALSVCFSVSFLLLAAHKRSCSLIKHILSVLVHSVKATATLRRFSLQISLKRRRRKCTKKISIEKRQPTAYSNGMSKCVAPYFHI